MKTLLPLLFFSIACWAAAPEEHRLATGQGIAAPNVTSLVNLSRGFTYENEAGVVYQGGGRLSMQGAKNGDTDFGGELGYSGSTMGIAAGMWEPGCDGCKSTAGGVAGFTMGKFAAAGVRYMVNDKTPTYGLGLILNQAGENRLGLNASQMDPDGDDNKETSYGAGYAYVTKEHTFALEGSQRKYEDPSNTTGDIVIASVSFQKRVGPLQASLSYEKRLEDDAENNDNFWIGVGFNSETWHLAVYSAYKHEMALVLSAFF